MIDLLLPVACLGEGFGKAGLQADHCQFVLERQVTVKAGRQAFHAVDQQIGLKGMASSGRRNITKSGIWFLPLYDPLCAPEKVSEFPQSDRITGVLPDRSS